MKSKKCKILNLNDNYITSKGFKYIIENLKSHPSLEKMYVKNNNIDYRILKLLSQNKQYFKSLKYFNFNGNNIENNNVFTKYKNILKPKGISLVIWYNNIVRL